MENSRLWRLSQRCIGGCLLLIAILGHILHTSLQNAVPLPTQQQHRRLAARINPPEQQDQQPLQRLLYIVTSMHEFDSGRRETTAGYDRFTHTLVPVIRESVASMLSTTGIRVDVYLITYYRLTPARQAQLRSALPPTVGLQVWDEAAPLAYRQEDVILGNNQSRLLQLHTRGLARQHRYVIKDKIFYYDMFVCFEDDMLIKGEHVEHYRQLTHSIYQWRLEASAKPTTTQNVTLALETFAGPMTRQQLGRTIPGFLRVETALDGHPPAARRRRHPKFLDHIPITLPNGTATTATTTIDPSDMIDASICCHVPHPLNEHVLPRPTGNDLIYWETRLDALGVRQLPDGHSWVVLLGGSNNEIWTDPAYCIGDYWSGRAVEAQQQQRPDRKLGQFLSNQGGWMATRRQIVEWHGQWCRGNFLPCVLQSSSSRSIGPVSTPVLFRFFFSCLDPMIFRFLPMMDLI